MLCAEETERETGPLMAEPPRLQASLQLVFARDNLTGQTILASSRQEPPLKVVRAFAVEEGGAMAHLHNVSGGLVGGDSLALSVLVGDGANVQLTTTGATRIYRPRRRAAVTTQRNDIMVADNALLEYVPDLIIPFAGARFSQHTTIKLGSGAGLFWWEILGPGRHARNEIFEYEHVEMKTELVAVGRCIATEHIRLEPKRYDVSSPVRLGPHRYCATFFICRVGLGGNAWLDLEQRVRKVIATLTPSGETLWGVSTLVADGLVVRCLAGQGSDVLPGLRAIWQAAKFALFGRDAVPPRKVN
jgi:urease accessory protein